MYTFPCLFFSMCLLCSEGKNIHRIKKNLCTRTYTHVNLHIFFRIPTNPCYIQCVCCRSYTDSYVELTVKKRS